MFEKGGWEGVRSEGGSVVELAVEGLMGEVRDNRETGREGECEVKLSNPKKISLVSLRFLNILPLRNSLMNSCEKEIWSLHNVEE